MTALRAEVGDLRADLAAVLVLVASTDSRIESIQSKVEPALAQITANPLGVIGGLFGRKPR